MRRVTAAALVLGVFLALGPADSARAEDLQFAGRSLSLAPPQGYCALDPARPQEAQMLEQQKKLQQQSELALMVLDCKDLDQLRSGGINPQRYGTVLVLWQQGSVHPLTDATRADFVAAVARQYAQTDLDAVRRELADQGQSPTTAGAARILGVLKQDDRAAYLGVAIDSISIDGKPVPAAIVGVTAITLLNRLPVSLNLYQVKGGADSISALLADQQHYVEALLAANAAAERPPMAGKSAPPEGPTTGAINLQSPIVQVILIAGLATLVAIVAALTLRRRKRPAAAPKEPIPPA